MVVFDSRSLHLTFLLVLEEGAVDAMLLGRRPQFLAQVMLRYPLRNVRLLRALAGKVGVLHPKHLRLLQHSPRAQLAPQEFTQIVSGILSMSLPSRLLLPRALADQAHSNHHEDPLGSLVHLDRLDKALVGSVAAAINALLALTTCFSSLAVVVVTEVGTPRLFAEEAPIAS